MTNRERIINTLQCKETDHAPFCMWLGFSPWHTALDRWKEESGISDLDVVKYFGFEPFFQVVPVEYGPMPHFESEVIEENDQYIVKTDYRGLTARWNIASGSIPEFVANPVETVDDWNIYKNERLQTRLDQRLSMLKDFAETARTVDAPIQVGAFPWGAFGITRDLFGVEKMLFDFYDSPDMMRDIMETYNHSSPQETLMTHPASSF